MTDSQYKSLTEDIFGRFPSVQKDGFGSGAYKPGLERMTAFLELLGNPHRRYRCIHVAGTNGKGSVCSMITSSLAASGLKTGLYTSPHILDFRERMRTVCDDKEGRHDLHLVSREYVYGFLTRWHEEFDRIGLSFFEITTGLAFKWFADECVDIAVVEVGLGGRLDSTNVITPLLSIITSIGLDHCDLLGDTLGKIAAEKAGIIKRNVPVVIGEYRSETAGVFRDVAMTRNAPLYFSSEDPPCSIDLDLEGECQPQNLRTVLTALRVAGFEPNLDAISHTASRTGFEGRWEHLRESPAVICDIGHNAHALEHNFRQLGRLVASEGYGCLVIVYAVMADKDLDAIFPLMPSFAQYIFTTPKGRRALPAGQIRERYLKSLPDNDLHGRMVLAVDDVRTAVNTALEYASQYKKPLVFIGGSTFAVAEAKPLFQEA